MRKGLFTLLASLGLAAGCATAPTTIRPIQNQLPLPPNAEVFDIAQLEVPPKPVLRGPPQYPFELRKAGITGEAVVDFIVTTDGYVANAHVVRASREEFAMSALACVRRWQFKPGIHEGVAANCHMQVPIVFTLNDR